jgi:hypothetical protein
LLFELPKTPSVTAFLIPLSRDRAMTLKNNEFWNFMPGDLNSRCGGSTHICEWDFHGNLPIARLRAGCKQVSEIAESTGTATIDGLMSEKTCAGNVQDVFQFNTQLGCYDTP